jgi:hypothetical protein
VRAHNRIVVDVDHVHRRVDFVRDLADIALGRQAGADVQQLSDTGLAHHEPDCAA